MVITQPAAPLKIESATPINLTGFETNNGSITVTVSGVKLITTTNGQKIQILL